MFLPKVQEHPWALLSGHTETHRPCRKSSVASHQAGQSQEGPSSAYREAPCLMDPRLPSTSRGALQRRFRSLLIILVLQGTLGMAMADYGPRLWMIKPEKKTLFKLETVATHISMARALVSPASSWRACPSSMDFWNKY